MNFINKQTLIKIEIFIWKHFNVITFFGISLVIIIPKLVKWNYYIPNNKIDFMIV